MKREELITDALEELIRWHESQGTDGILILGTTGETPSLTEEEQDKIVETAVKTAGGRIPVIANSGTNNTERSLEKSG